MKRAWPIVVLIAGLVSAWLVGGQCAFAAGQTPTAEHVTIVLAPYLQFSDVTPQATPNLWRLAQNGAVGAVNARSRTREEGEPASPIESALVLTSGAWAQPDFSAMAAFNATESVVGTETASAVYERVFGHTMDGAQIGYLGLPATQRLNDSNTSGAVLGTLGQAVRDNNGLTAAVGNSDSGNTEGLPRRLRPAAIAAMDGEGLVRCGDVSPDVLHAVADAPYGVATDLTAFEREFRRVSAFAKGHRGPSLVVLDPGDPTRARRYASQVTTAVAAEQWTDALATLDVVVGMAEKQRGSNGVVIVVSQALYPAGDSGPTRLGPIVVAGEGWSGYLTSSSTHRTGIVTLPDVTATTLTALGIASPVAVVGDPMASADGPADATDRLGHLARQSDAAFAVDTPRSTVLDSLIGLVVALLAAAALLIGFAGAVPSGARLVLTRLLQALVLLVLSVPVAGWLMGMFTPAPTTPSLAIASLVVTSCVLWFAALVMWRFTPLRVPVAALALVFSAVIVFDQLLGAPLSATGFFSYSVLLGARFYGMGNEAAALLFGASLVGSALLFDQWPESSFAQRGRAWGLPLLGAVVIVFAAAPFWGANVGVAVWALAGFACAWALMNGKRIGVKSVLAAAALIIVVVGALAAVDLLGGGETTHLARALTSASQGGAAELWSIVARKAETNLRVLGSTNWSWVLVAALAFLGFARFRPGNDYPRLIADNRSFYAAVVASLVAGALAMLTEDSGIVIPSLIMLYTAMGLVWLMLSRVPESDSKEIS